MRHTIDPRIDRLRTSRLDLDTDDATWLAGVADEVHATAGTRIGHRRFVHVVRCVSLWPGPSPDGSRAVVAQRLPSSWPVQVLFRSPRPGVVPARREVRRRTRREAQRGRGR
jgi:hypothetical protein